MEKILHNRKFKLLIACLSLILLLDIMQDTYAKYISSADATSNFSIARWSFLVNDQDVLSNSDFSTTIIPTFDASSHIASGVIAPTSTGHFEVEIDSSNVGVSFDEIITLSHGEDNTVGDIVFTGYKKNNDPVVSLTNNTNTITTTHLLGQATTVDTYIFYIQWNDDPSTQTMDNASDTAAAASGTAAVNVNIQFIQRASQASQSSSPSEPSAPNGD